jgi:hypothetical protein
MPTRLSVCCRCRSASSTSGGPALHAPLTADPADILDHPYRLVDDDEVGIYVAGLLPLYDAALAILADDPAKPADYELLSASWRRACLPSRFTPTNPVRPPTQTALASLSSACQFPRSCLTPVEQRGPFRVATSRARPDLEHP